LYECLTAKVAFDAPNVAQILMKIINQPTVPPTQQVAGLPPRIDDVVDKGLRKDKTKRYDTASKLVLGVCDAYGVEANIEHWATTSMADITAALASARAPAAAAFVESMRPSSQPTAGSSSTSSYSPPTRSSGVVIGVAVGAVAVVAVVAALLLR
jgi:serine/threonine protein kinase